MGKLIQKMLAPLPYRAAMVIVREILASQGHGGGTDFRASGEMRVFDMVRGDAPTLVDVGGFKGEYTKAFLDRFPSGRSIVFEPSPAHFEIAVRNLSGRNVALRNVALGAMTGSGTLHKDTEITGLASLTKRALVNAPITEPVTIETLDSVAGIGVVDLLKIDVEGHELDVMRGARRLFESGAISLVQFEFGGANLDTHTTFRDFWNFLTERGFALHIVRPAGITLLKRYREISEQYRTTNFVATRPR